MNVRGGSAALNVARWIVGATFLFSGFVKSVDPVGTSIYVEEYFSTYSLDMLDPLSSAAAVALGAAELCIGAMLCCRLLTRAAALAAVLLLALFTVVTLLGATVLPIGECGCFGSVLTLSPWATFAKNLILLPLSYAVLRSVRGESLWRMSRRRTAAFAAVVFTALGINIYAYRHLPLIDFMPYRVGVDLAEEIRAEREALASAVSARLVCRNESTGQVKEFDADDPSWWEGWEVVSTHAEDTAADTRFGDFALYDISGDEVSHEVLDFASRQHLLCIARMDYLSPRSMRRIDSFVSRAEAAGERVVCLTADDLEGDMAVVAGHVMRCYNIDAMVLRSMLRAGVGVVTLDDGVIVDKRSWRDM